MTPSLPNNPKPMPLASGFQVGAGVRGPRTMTLIIGGETEVEEDMDGTSEQLNRAFNKCLTKCVSDEAGGRPLLLVDGAERKPEIVDAEIRLKLKARSSKKDSPLVDVTVSDLRGLRALCDFLETMQAKEDEQPLAPLLAPATPRQHY